MAAREVSAPGVAAAAASAHPRKIGITGISLFFIAIRNSSTSVHQAPSSIIGSNQQTDNPAAKDKAHIIVAQRLYGGFLRFFRFLNSNPCLALLISFRLRRREFAQNLGGGRWRGFYTECGT
jgi:hypothetical protein